jgi:hypothetical protein
MVPEDRRTRHKEAIQMAFFELLLGLASIGFCNSMIPPEIAWPLLADDVNWLRKWPGTGEVPRSADG